MTDLLLSSSMHFVGREDDTAILARMILQRRLVTLLGTGGIGKTRLALQVAAEVEARFGDGVHVLEFASLSQPEQLLSLVAASIDVREQEGQPLQQTVIAALRPRHILLLFDNCEHVITASAALAHILLQHCPRLHILATSREALRLTGESLWLVPSLSYPPLSTPLAPADALHYDAIRLFYERARAADPAFSLSSTNSVTLAHICHYLDGIPLALELAAASLSQLSLKQLTASLARRFPILNDKSRAVARHQTLQATFDWGYMLLYSEEQTVLQRLATIFCFSWTLEAAESVCIDERIGRSAILTLLTQLQHKSWLIAEKDSAGKAIRYRLLETIRRYTQQQHPIEETVQSFYAQHWEWYLHFIEETSRRLSGAEQAYWLERVESELDNLRLALERSLAAQQLAITVRIAIALGPFWTRRSRLSEGRAWYERLLAHPDLPSSSRGILSQHMIEILRIQGEYTQIRALLKERVTQLKKSVAPPGAELAEAHCALGWAAFYQGDYEEALSYCNEGLKLFQEVGDRIGQAKCLAGLALVAMLQQEYSRATTLLQEVIAIRRAAGDSAELTYALNTQARVALLQNKKRLAYEACQEALQLVSISKQLFGSAYCLEAIAALAELYGHIQEAIQLFGKAHALRTALDISHSPPLELLRAHDMLPLRTRLGEEAFAAAWADGEALSLEQSYTQAQTVLEQVRTLLAQEAGAAGSGQQMGLSKRELEVLHLVGDGLTDEQVAQELVLSTRTVSTHLRSIYRKLGVSSRSAAIRFAVDHDLL